MAGADAADDQPKRGEQRLDKWLWFARIAKTRTLAARLVADGKIRLNRVRVGKPSQSVKPGDVITASVGPKVRVLCVVGPGERRGPPSEAQLLYDELTVAMDMPKSAALEASSAVSSGGRPTKRERRQINRLKGRDA